MTSHAVERNSVPTSFNEVRWLVYSNALRYKALIAKTSSEQFIVQTQERYETEREQKNGDPQ